MFVLLTVVMVYMYETAGENMILFRS